MTSMPQKSCSEKTKKSTILTRKSRKTDLSKDSVPPLRCHKRSGTAYVHINGERWYLGAILDTEHADVNVRKIITEKLDIDSSVPSINTSTTLIV